MSAHSVPPEKSLDRRGVEAIIIGVAGALPGVGALISAGLQAGLATGQERLVRQFLTELAQAQDRFLMRLGDVELDAFLARREAAAAINQATQLALRTPSREKHRLLGRAALNAAASDSEDALIPFFWYLVDKHSALEVRLLSALDDPVNRAIDHGIGDYVHGAIATAGGPNMGNCLFAVVPELGHEVWEDAMEEEMREDEIADYWEADEDVSGNPDRGWLLEHLARRLDADGLLDTESGEDGSVALLLHDSDEYLSIKLFMGRDSRPDESGHYEARSFSDVSHLGRRYLAFLAEEPSWPTEPIPRRGSAE